MFHRLGALLCAALVGLCSACKGAAPPPDESARVLQPAAAKHVPVIAEHPVVAALLASSTLQPAWKYDALLAMDGDPTTSWVEGAADDGVGEALELRFDNPAYVKEIEFNNGIGNPKHWANNNRVERLIIASDQPGVAAVEVTLQDQAPMQRIELPAGFYAGKLTLTIGSVYRGIKWRDTCIAEVRIPGAATPLPKPPRAPPPKWALGVWEHEGEGWSLVLNGDGNCLSHHRPQGDEEESQIRCSLDVDGNKIIVTLHEATGGRTLQLLYKPAEPNRLWWSEDNFALQRLSPELERAARKRLGW